MSRNVIFQITAYKVGKIKKPTCGKETEKPKQHVKKNEVGRITLPNFKIY